MKRVVNVAEAKAKLPELIDAITKKEPPVVLLRTDETPQSPPDNVTIDRDFFEVRL